jgi:hypothetical protein
MSNRETLALRVRPLLVAAAQRLAASADATSGDERHFWSWLPMQFGIGITGAPIN